jgi:glutamyl-tRNA synthetase
VSADAVRGRYAPSPTGDLHLGNVRTALLAWLFARAAGGAFVLRIEDLDAPRVRSGSTTQILDDLRWLGLDWDEGGERGGPLGPYVQSQRDALYDAALSCLRGKGLLYPCYCTRAELSRVASAPHAGETERRYPGTCRSLTVRERQAREAEGRRPALRFGAPITPITFTDMMAGTVVEDVGATAGDIVVRRSDGLFAYQLAVVVDDALMGITQVVRGVDLLPSTARQLALFDALGYARPHIFAHVPLALDRDGTRLSKRTAAEGVGQLRSSSVASSAVLGALAASCGLWPPGEPASVAALLAAFDPTRLQREPTPILV